MREVVPLLSADIDLQQTYELLEARRDGAGGEFLADYRRATALLGGYPLIAPRYVGDFRRLIFHRRSYGIYYRIHGRRVFIHAVLNLRTDPDYILERLRI